jgi:hypothetical protein
VDLQFEIAVGKMADGDGVVEVAGGFAVDGDDGQRAEIAAMAKFCAGITAGMACASSSVAAGKWCGR